MGGTCQRGVAGLPPCAWWAAALKVPEVMEQTACLPTAPNECRCVESQDKDTVAATANKQKGVREELEDIRSPIGVGLRRAVGTCAWKCTIGWPMYLLPTILQLQPRQIGSNQSTELFLTPKRFL